MNNNSGNQSLFDKKNSIAPLVLILIHSFYTCLSAYTLEVYTDKSIKYRVFQQNRYLWMATNGGAIRWDMTANRATEYTTAQGLSDNFLKRAIADSVGNVWFSSRTVLNRFDGQTWHTYKDLPGSSNTAIYSQVLFSNDAGKILYTYYNYANTIFACFDGANQLPNNAISGALVWTDTAKRRWEWLRASALRPYPSSNYPQPSYFTVASAPDTFTDSIPEYNRYMAEASYVDLNGRLWVPFCVRPSSFLAPVGYSMFDGLAWHHVGDTSILARPAILDITIPALPIDAAAGRFKYRFLRIDGKTDTVDCSKWDEFIRVKDSLCIPPSMTMDTAGRLWIGTTSGLVCCEKSGATEFDLQTGPLGAGTSLVEDKKGNIWGNNVSIFNGRTWTYPQKTNSRIASFHVAKAVPSSSDSGGMWLKSGTSLDENANLVGNGLAYYNGRSWDEITFYTKSNGLASDAVLDMAVDSLNTLWCVCGGNSRNLCKFINNAWTTIAVPTDLKGDIRQLFIDRKGGIWLIAYNTARFNGAKWQVFPNILYEGRAGCNDVFEDSKGIMWFATYSQGLYRYDGTNWSTIIIDDAPDSAMVTSIGEDLTGMLWVGLGYDGLWRQNGAGWKKVSTIDGLGFDLVTTMLCDKSGAMWFACNSGSVGDAPCVSRFDGAQWKAFTTKDGFADTRIFSMLNAKNGDIWFGSYTGVTRLKPDGLAARFVRTAPTTSSDRPSISKIVVMPAHRSGTMASAALSEYLQSKPV
jgi:ligand-binding sensor domain-containing protein